MAKTHFFDVSLAVRYGPIESIILTNLCWWLEKNKENQKHYFHGRYWVYNSIKAFENLFPYLKREQIRRTLERLKGNGVLYVGKFNKMGYDRTLWYSVSDEVLALYQDKKDAYLYKKDTTNSGELPNGKLHLAPVPNANSQTGNTEGETDKNRPESGPLEDKNPAVEAESGPETPLKPDNSGENDQKRANLPKYPNGQLHLAPAPNANSQTGNTEGETDKNRPESGPLEDKNPAVEAESGPEGRETAAGNDQMVNSIWRQCQIDPANLPNRSGANAEPIPDINAYKPVAAAANPVSPKITQEMIRGALKRVNGGLTFGAGFYQKAELYMNREGLDLEYFAFIYRECQARRPENLRGMYYTLTFQDDLTELYKNMAEDRRRSLIRCPVCGTEYGENQAQCPECSFPTSMKQDEAKVRFERRLYQLDDAEKERYTEDLFEAHKKHPNHGEAWEEVIKGLGKKYQLLE